MPNLTSRTCKAALSQNHSQVKATSPSVAINIHLFNDGASGVGELFSPPYYNVWNGDSPSSVLAAMDLVSSSIDANNVDIIFAHSDGGAAALSALLHRAHNVKCIILISPFPPFDASGRKRLDVSMAGPLVHVPTLLVRGETDPFAFFVAMAKGLVDEKNLTVYSWKGGHEPPNSSERGMWAQMAQDVVQIINRR